jgi:release factor glutamine methyltransferase
MKSLLEVLTLSANYLKERGIEHSRRQAEELLCDVLALSRLNLYLEFERPLTEKELSLCRERLARRAKGEPLPYIHGQVEFYDCSILVSPATLIPRQETEILVDKAAQALARLDLKGKVLWDICCGSGCIGIALKKRFPDLQVALSDLSAEALAIAKQNADRNEVEVDCLQGDLLAPFKGKKAHFVICNPPYIAESEFQSLEVEVRRYEPKMALIGGETGVEFYERLNRELPAYLEPRSSVWLEIGYQQGKAVEQIFSGKPWKTAKLENDWSGQNRFFFLENE